MMILENYISRQTVYGVLKVAYKKWLTLREKNPTFWKTCFFTAKFRPVFLFFNEDSLIIQASYCRLRVYFVLKLIMCIYLYVTDSNNLQTRK